MSTENQASLNLREHHLAELRASGLNDDTIREAGIYTEENHSMVLVMLQRRQLAKRLGPAIVFPYRDDRGELNGYRRCKFDNPRTDRNGKKIKYESPVGAPNRVYVPPSTFKVLDDSAIELCLTEGEKKSLKADQEGFPCIGLVGVFGWKDKAERLLPDLERIPWQNRKVFIVFDSDAETKEEVKDAESRLAAVLQRNGAIVKVVRLPDGPDGEKQGVDDFLVRHGAPALRKLIDRAEDPTPVKAGVEKLPASKLDPMPEARRMLKQLAMSGDFCTLKYWQGESFHHDGKKYRLRTDDEMRAAVIQWLDPAYTHLTKSAVANMLQCLQADAQLGSQISPPCWLGKPVEHRNYIALQNGILDLDALLAEKDDVLLPHNPRWFSTICLPYEFDLDADCPKWLAMLERNLEGDQQRITKLQEWAGYLLDTKLSLQKFLFLQGDGGNGKSVVLAGIEAMLGLENCSHVPLEAFGIRFSLMPSLGKLANICAEVGELDRIAEGFLKQFTSGDRMQFERKFKEPIEAIPTARLILSSNDLPRFRDRSSGIWRRMDLMPFNVTIPDDERVVGMDRPDWWQEQGELPGILNWALAGLMQLRERGRFTASDVCDSAAEQYRLESNPARLFLEEHYMPSTRTHVETTEAYKKYHEWCEANGYRPLGERMFGKEVYRAFPKTVRRRAGASNGRFYVYGNLEQISE